MPTVRIALDWTPNANHAALFGAQHLFEGLDIEFISPHSSGYSETPHNLVRAGKADVGIGPSESVISSFLEHGDDSIVAIGALAQQDDSAIVTLKSSGIDSPSKLDGKRYASYSARFEGRIVQHMIKFAGGTGDYQELSPEKLGVFDTLLSGEYDATWVFLAHEGVIAARKGVELNVFRLADYGVDYGYPLVYFKSRTEGSNDDAIILFMKQLKKAYKWVVENPKEAAANMVQCVNKLYSDLPIDADQIEQSVALASKTFLDAEGHGLTMTERRWASFVDWLYDVGLMTTKMQTRGPVSDTKTTLDGLRGDDAGAPLDRSACPPSALFTNKFLM